jgi:hypothetical protein
MRTYNYYYVSTVLVVKLESEPLQENENLEEEILSLGKEDFAEDKSENWNLTPNPDPNPPPSVRGKLCRASFFVGVRLDTLLYSVQNLRTGLGLFTGSEVQGPNARISKKLIRNFYDAAAIGVLSSAYVVFVLKSGTAYPQWGNRHRTYLVYDARKSFETLCEFLYSNEYNVGGGVYEIAPNSVKERRARKGIKTG